MEDTVFLKKFEEFERKMAEIDKREREVTRRERAIMRRRRWDKAHLATIATKVTADEAARFYDLCHSMGTTRYRAVARFVRDMLDRHGG